MAENFTAPNQIRHVTLSATPGVQTEVNFHIDARACDVEFFAAGGTSTPSLGQVAWTGTDNVAIGVHVPRPVAANTDWPFALRFAESENAIQKIYLSSAIASAVVVVVSFEAPQ